MRLLQRIEIQSFSCAIFVLKQVVMWISSKKNQHQVSTNMFFLSCAFLATAKLTKYTHTDFFNLEQMLLTSDSCRVDNDDDDDVDEEAVVGGEGARRCSLSTAMAASCTNIFN